MEQSILKSVKQTLGIGDDYAPFDPEITLHVNSVLSILNQLGIGPADGFMIEDDTAVWSDFMGDDPRLNSVKTLVYLRVRMLFDPPATSYLIGAYEKQIQEIEWRLNVQREATAWVDPSPVIEDPDELVLDGGHPWEL